LKGNGYTYGIKSEFVAGYDFRDCGCYFIHAYGGFVDVLDEYETRYMFFYEYLELVYGAAQEGSYGPSKTCDKVP
jgi:hypothetical protein